MKPSVRSDELAMSVLRPLCQVVGLPGPHLRHPDVHSSVAVRKKGYEPAVARHGRRLFVAWEVGQPLKAGIHQEVDERSRRSCQTVTSR